MKGVFTPIIFFIFSLIDTALCRCQGSFDASRQETILRLVPITRLEGEKRFLMVNDIQPAYYQIGGHTVERTEYEEVLARINEARQAVNPHSQALDPSEHTHLTLRDLRGLVPTRDANRDGVIDEKDFRFWRRREGGGYLSPRQDARLHYFMNLKDCLSRYGLLESPLMRRASAIFRCDLPANAQFSHVPANAVDPESITIIGTGQQGQQISIVLTRQESGVHVSCESRDESDRVFWERKHVRISDFNALARLIDSHPQPVQSVAAQSNREGLGIAERRDQGEGGGIPMPSATEAPPLNDEGLGITTER